MRTDDLLVTIWRPEGTKAESPFYRLRITHVPTGFTEEAGVPSKCWHQAAEMKCLAALEKRLWHRGVQMLLGWLTVALIGWAAVKWGMR